MGEIIQQLEAQGLQPKVTVLRGVPTRYRKSLWGVKSRVSGKNRKGQVAHGVGNMDVNQVMSSNESMTNR